MAMGAARVRGQLLLFEDTEMQRCHRAWGQEGAGEAAFEHRAGLGECPREPGDLTQAGAQWGPAPLFLGFVCAVG